MFGKLLKAGVAIALTPAAVVIDVVSAPVRSCDYARDFDEPFLNSTSKLIKSAGKNIGRALE